MRRIWIDQETGLCSLEDTSLHIVADRKRGAVCSVNKIKSNSTAPSCAYRTVNFISNAFAAFVVAASTATVALFVCV